jgi:hypothetical protein
MAQYWQYRHGAWGRPSPFTWVPVTGPPGDTPSCHKPSSNTRQRPQRLQACASLPTDGTKHAQIVKPSRGVDPRCDHQPVGAAPIHLLQCPLAMCKGNNSRHTHSSSTPCHEKDGARTHAGLALPFPHTQPAQLPHGPMQHRAMRATNPALPRQCTQPYG